MVYVCRLSCNTVFTFLAHHVTADDKPFKCTTCLTVLSVNGISLFEITAGNKRNTAKIPPLVLEILQNVSEHIININSVKLIRNDVIPAL